MDETSSLETLLAAVDAGEIQGRPQIVLRLHPTSREAFFSRFSAAREDVHLSRYEGYIPWMAWAPWRDEVVLAGNLIRHADVCVSPGSTMTIEAAIFDTPVVMPVMNAYQPDAYNGIIDQHWLQAHFKPMADRGLLPIVRSEEEYISSVNRGLNERAWFKDQRREIREMLLGPLDGKATERLAQVIKAAAAGGLPGDEGRGIGA
jgi:hypothetical protein